MKDKTSSSGLFRGKRNVVLCLDALCFAKFSNHFAVVSIIITPTVKLVQRVDFTFKIYKEYFNYSQPYSIQFRARLNASDQPSSVLPNILRCRSDGCI